MTDLEHGLLERLQGVFRETLDDRSLKITKETAQADISEWDSMFQITLIMAIEKQFDVRLTAREASQLVSVRAILDFLKAKNAQAHANE